MSERYLQFENVGRAKFSGKRLLHPEITSPDEIAQVACEEACQHLMSRDVHATYDSEINKGNVFAGGRNVGGFAISELTK